MQMLRVRDPHNYVLKPHSFLMYAPLDMRHLEYRDEIDRPCPAVELPNPSRAVNLLAGNIPGGGSPTASDRRVVRERGQGQDLPCPFKRRQAKPGEAFTARCPVQVISPFQFSCRVPIEDFIKETHTDLVTDQSLPRR
jgi:hypothetical protein